VKVPVETVGVDGEEPPPVVGVFETGMFKEQEAVEPPLEPIHDQKYLVVEFVASENIPAVQAF
jgi:hypothetical protein